MSLRNRNHAGARGGLNQVQAQTTRHHLESLFVDTNRLSENEPLYRQALASAESSYAADHPETATAVTNLAELRSSPGAWPRPSR